MPLHDHRNSGSELPRGRKTRLTHRGSLHCRAEFTPRRSILDWLRSPKSSVWTSGLSDALPGAPARAVPARMRILIEVSRGRDEVIVAKWLDLAEANEMRVCSPVTVAELWHGASL